MADTRKDIMEELFTELDEHIPSGNTIPHTTPKAVPKAAEATEESGGFEETLSDSRGRSRLWFLTVNNPTVTGIEFNDFLKRLPGVKHFAF